MPTRVIYRPIANGDFGYYDRGADEIVVNKSLSRVEKMCTLEHERTHAMLGHTPLSSVPQHIAREIAVDRLTASRLIPFGALVAAFRLFDNSASRAEYLRVDLETYVARVLGLDDLEQTMLEVCGRYCTKALASVGEVVNVVAHVASAINDIVALWLS